MKNHTRDLIEGLKENIYYTLKDVLPQLIKVNRTSHKDTN